MKKPSSSEEGFSSHGEAHLLNDSPDEIMGAGTETEPYSKERREVPRGDRACTVAGGGYGGEDGVRGYGGQGTGATDEEVASTSAREETGSAKGGWGGFEELAAALAVLAVFSVLGFLLRFGLEEAFGSQGLRVVAGWSTLFDDLPANCVGCYFMGVLAFGLRDRINGYHTLLYMGLTTGLMGSLTTYASWNQDMARLLVADSWGSGLVGLLIGIELPVCSLLVGEESGHAVEALLRLWYPLQPLLPSKAPPQSTHIFRRRLLLWVCLTSYVFLVIPLAVVGTVVDKGSITRRKTWLGCLLAPFGVWIRWGLSMLNGQWAKGTSWAWLPLGTLLANVIASVLEAAMAVTYDGVDGYAATLHTTAVMAGFLGAMSTVSTFALELHTLHKGKGRWRAYSYCLLSVATTQALALLTYGIPVWVKHFRKAYPP